MVKIDVEKWELYLSRPFNLFGVSLWYALYSSGLSKKILGDTFTESGLFIEYPAGIARCYKVKRENKKLWQFVENLVVNRPEKLKAMIKEGMDINKEAEKMLEEKDIPDLETAVNFLIKSGTLSTDIPNRTGKFLGKIKDEKLLEMIKDVRGVSYYPRIINEIVASAAKNELKKMGITDKEAINVVTVQEILEKKKINIESRLKQFKKGKTYIYYNINGKETIEWTKDPTALINKIEKAKTNRSNLIKGNTSFAGNVKGKVKLILTNKITSEEADKFNKGDVLVAISTSPNLMPIIKKAGAIVTDEGGITSHAAILSREFKIPCIIGTKIATQVLKDGDLVEVDAEHGIVRKIK